MRLGRSRLIGVSAIALFVSVSERLALADDTVTNPATTTKPAADVPAAGVASGSDVIVTGTRETGRKLQDSPTSIAVVSGDALAATGKSNVLDALKAVLPSVNTLAVGGDLGNLIRSFSLRGLSPSHTLVLVNGKRWHTSAYIYAGQSPFTGSTSVDLGLIPLAAIDHIEVLRDGAAAQYGTDAIAGVVNIILKSDNHGATASFLGGATYDGDGLTLWPSIDGGAKLGSDGFIHLTFDYDHHDHTNRNGYDPRTNYTVRGKIYGDASYDTQSAAFNLAKPVGDAITLYGFGTFAHRDAESLQNYRTRTQLGSAVTAVYPNGFYPIEAIDEYDFGLTGGVKGKSLLGWDWDYSTTYGRDAPKIRTTHSINPNLLTITGDAQTDFNDGQFIASQLTNTLDFKRAVDTGLWQAPLNVAFGLEHRYETYEVDPGELNSYVYGGATAYPGFTPSSASNASRNIGGAYVDLATRIVPKWQNDIAGRYEYYADTGSAWTGKLSTRYDVADWIGVRGTVGNGYHAPSLAQEYFASTQVTPTSATAQLPVNSNGARILGAPELKPEKATNLSIGLVSEPIPHLHASVDAYQIIINDRIISTGALFGPLALQAITANGNVAPPTIPLSNIAAQYFTNGVDTRTRGIDFNADYPLDLGRFGDIRWLLAGTYNVTAITHTNPAPPALQAARISLTNPAVNSYLTTATPAVKVAFSGTYFKDQWEVTLRETYFGPSSEYSDPVGNGRNYYRTSVNAAIITDLDVKYTVTPNFIIEAGADNLLNVYPNKQAPFLRGSTGASLYAGFSPYGINGGYYFSRVVLKF